MKDGKKMAKDIGAAAYIEISAKDTSTYGDLWETVLRYTINEHKSQKKHGKNCWSIQCPAKITPINRVTCQGRCKLYYCEDCMEYWGDGRKLCPQCVMYAQTELKEQGKEQPDIKKKRLPPSARAAIELEKEAKKLEKLKKKYEKELAKQGKTIEEAIQEYEEKEAAKEDKEKEKEEKKVEKKEKKESITESSESTATAEKKKKGKK